MKKAIAVFLLWAGGYSGLAFDPVAVRNAAEFNRIVPRDAVVRKLAGNMQFLEGPVWMPFEGGFLIFSDIPADELKRWNPERGLAMFRKPSHKANGNALDRKGRLVSCEEGGRRVTMTEKDGTVRLSVDQFEGKKFAGCSVSSARGDPMESGATRRGDSILPPAMACTSSLRMDG